MKLTLAGRRKIIGALLLRFLTYVYEWFLTLSHLFFVFLFFRMKMWSSHSIFLMKSSSRRGTDLLFLCWWWCLRHHSRPLGGKMCWRGTQTCQQDVQCLLLPQTVNSCILQPVVNNTCKRCSKVNLYCHWQMSAGKGGWGGKKWKKKAILADKSEYCCYTKGVVDSTLIWR